MKNPGVKRNFKKIRAMKCYDAVYERISSGWSMKDVARYIQEDKKELLGISRKSLEVQLGEFRKQMPPGDLVAKRFPEAFDTALAKLDTGIDEVKELEDLYRMQMTRVNIDFKVETNIKKLLPSMTSEIREARQILESLSNLKMELGILSRASKEIDVNVEVEQQINNDLGKFGNQEVQQVIQNPESRRRVLGVIDQFLRLPASDKDAVVISKETN